MGIVKGGFQRLLQSLLYALCFACAAIVLGIYSYFLAVETKHNLGIPRWEKAVEGISGVIVIYTIFATILTCCLGGVTLFAFLAIVLDICMLAGFIAIAVMTRHGASSCSGNVNTPLGSGLTNGRSTGTGTYSPNLASACKLNTAVFAVSIIGAVLFLLTALMQVLLARHHKKEKRFGPSPANDYTSGSGKKRGLFSRKPKNQTDSNVARDAELGAVGAGAGAAAHHHHKNKEVRPSHDTGYTGETVTGNNGTGLVQDNDPHFQNQVATGATHHHHHDGHAPHGSHGGYYTQPQGTGANPYGYDNTTGTAYNDTAYNAPTTGTAPFGQTLDPNHHNGVPTTGTARNF